MVWNCTVAFEAVGVRSKWTSVDARFFFLLGLFVSHFVELPEASKALLTTEVGGFKLHLDTSRALHGCNLGAVWSRTGLG